LSSLLAEDDPNKVKKKKKTVTWVDDAKLREFFYFPMDENERGEILLKASFN
jgi:hypothetical protein